jgi:hypothetical protein
LTHSLAVAKVQVNRLDGVLGTDRLPYEKEAEKAFADLRSAVTTNLVAFDVQVRLTG